MGQRANSAVIDIDYLLGLHYRVVDLSEVDRCRYLALWALATKLGKELLPEAYNLTHPEILSMAINCKKSRQSLSGTMKSLATKELVCVGTVDATCTNRAARGNSQGQNGGDCSQTVTGLLRIVVVGLGDRYPSREIEKHDWSNWFGSVRFGSDCTTNPTRARGSDSKNEDNDDSGIETEPWIGQVFEILRSIDAKHYRTLTANEGWVRDLNTAAANLGGNGRVIEEAQLFRSWIDGRFETGKLRRNADHNPRQRFAVNWIKTAVAKAKEWANGNPKHEKPTDRIAREAREREQARLANA